MHETHWVDRATAWIAPRWTLQRARARVAADLLARTAYEAASMGRRTQGWKRISGDANAALGISLGRLRDAARDLVRNNPYAESALSTIVDHTVGWGITASIEHEAWKAWAESTACDAEGRHDLAGLQKLVMRSVVESGEVLVRRRVRRLEDRLPLPLQLQVLEADFLDTAKDATLPNGGRIVQGVEFDAIGRRVAYWLFREHPGSSVVGTTRFSGSQRVPAADVQHIFKVSRPGQVRGPSWFAPELLRFKDLDEFEDATLMKQKIAACLAVITSDVDGSAPPLGKENDEDSSIDMLVPGMIMNAPPGRSIEVVQPPNVRDYADYTKTQQRAIATGLGVTYEDMTGDYTELPFSAARMSRLRHWARIDDNRWRILIPQFLVPVWGWAMEMASIVGLPAPVESVEWTAPPLPMIEPDKEGLAIQRNIRSGITTLSEEIRARGYQPTKFLDELQKDFEELDRRKLVLDIDPRKMTQAGQWQTPATKPAGSDS